MVLSSRYNRNGRLLFIAKYSYEQKEELKEQGFSWNGQDKVWETSDYFQASKFIEYAEEHTKRLLVEYIKDGEKLYSIGQQKDSTIQVPCKEGISYFPHQKVTVEFLANADNILIADQVGAGKSISAIACINYFHFKKILIICPNTLKFNWKLEVEKWLVDDLKINLIYAGKGFDITDINIVNYDVVDRYKDSFLQEWDLVICDEAHKLKNKNTLRSKATFEILEKAHKVIFMTGTPILNEPSEIYSLLKVLCPRVFFNSTFFYKRYCDAKQITVGYDRIKQQPKIAFDKSGASNLEELNYKLYRTVMIRRRLEDVIDNLPDKSRQVIYLNELEKIVMQEKEHYKNALREYIINKKIDPDKAKIEFLTKWTDIRHKTALAKVYQVSEFVETLIDGGEKVILFAHHADVIDFYHRRFKGSSVTLTGKDSASKRQKAVDSFQNNPDIKVFIGSIQAANAGITLTASHIVVFAELDPVPSIMNQCEGRPWRIGQKNHVQIYHLIIDGSLDSSIVNKLIKKQEIIDQAIEIPSQTNLLDLEILDYIKEDEVNEN
jgi:SWI/SNF-related matrix-associated actin-dependent regulator 1 of chromatin subfamily A